jgi:hypothetical protein
MSEHADSDTGSWDLSKRPCVSCEGYSRDVEDGLCAGCRGESSHDPERVKAATAVILGWKSEATLRAEAWAEYELTRHREARLRFRAKGFDR